MKNNEPQSFDEAVNKIQWQNVMEVEFDALVRNDTWTLMELPLDKDVIGTKWIYKTKYKSNGSINKHKARLVAKGYAQQEALDSLSSESCFDYHKKNLLDLLVLHASLVEFFLTILLHMMLL